jgi:hypothetical protein
MEGNGYVLSLAHGRAPASPIGRGEVPDSGCLPEPRTHPGNRQKTDQSLRAECRRNTQIQYLFGLIANAT